MSRARLIAFRLISIAGLAVSLYLVKQHIEFRMSGETRGVCALFESFDCAAIEQSAFSEVAGVPTASFGVLYFVILAAFAWGAAAEKSVGRRQRVASRSPTRAVAAGLTLAGLLTSLALASVSGLVIKAFCLGCAAVYAITLLNAGVVAQLGAVQYLADAMAAPAAAWSGLKAMIPADGTWERNRGRTMTLWIVFAIAPLSLAMPPFLIHRSKAKEADEKASEVMEKYLAGIKVEFEMSEHALVTGPEDAPLQIVVFTDFECPYCQTFSEPFKKMLGQFEGRYRLTYKHFPLSPACNRLLRDPRNQVNHAKACPLAEMAQALAAMGKFWEVGEELYTVKPADALGPKLAEIAEKAGLDYKEWAAHVSDPEVRAQIGRDIEEAIRLGVASLPTVFVNGRKVESIKVGDIETVLAEVAKTAP